MKFKYLRLPCKATDPFPHRRSVLRPIINIVLKSQNRSLRLYALLDTGADWCLFPTSVGEYLHIPVKQGKKLEFRGISAPATAYFHEVTLEIGGWKHNCLVGFSPSLDEMEVAGVLGQIGFFDHYNVTFNFNKQSIEVKKSV